MSVGSRGRCPWPTMGPDRFSSAKDIMNPPKSRDAHKAFRPQRLLVTGALTGILAAGTLAACDSGSGNDAASSSPRSPSTPDTASFSGAPPSSLASSAASAVASARASASAAASSAAARASAFEASVDAETLRAGAAAEKELKGVEGRGNAIAEVAMTGLPKARTGGLTAVLVTITNKTGQKASYAVQIDFENSSGKIVETRFVGKEDLSPGEKVQPIAFSRQSSDAPLTARLAKAQRY